MRRRGPYGGMVVLALILCVAAGCDGVSERALFERASAAIRSQESFPKGAALGSMEQAVIQVCKNAARVDITYQVTGAAGQAETGTYTVWLSNMAHDWEVDRCLKRSVPVAPAEKTP